VHGTGSPPCIMARHSRNRAGTTLYQIEQHLAGYPLMEAMTRCRTPRTMHRALLLGAHRALLLGAHRALLLGVLVLAAAAPVNAQQAVPAGTDWDGARALELVERARERRLVPAQDTTLRNYSARAEGFVYFYLDRRDTDERTLVKVDQVALEVFWAPPDRTKQRIVGLRDASRLPNRMHYHLDHLTVVQDGFGDVIRMGDGDEVGAVPHPAGPGSGAIYEFRLADSLTLQLPGAREPIRVYELQIRPRRHDQPALIGSMFVDRARGDIVRMTFTFTPVSYVDRRLDYISVSLDNGLWEGRYWLPHEQTLQIRRQIPELDFAAGAVIHGRMRIGDYVFNDSLPPRTFFGPALTAVPVNERESFDFERGLFDDLNEAGLAPPADLAHIRQQAAALMGTARLTGLPHWRLSLGSASTAVRYNRAEGAAVGAGLTWAPGPPLRMDAHAGFAFGAGRPWGDVSIRADVAPATTSALRLAWREPRDLGVRPGVPGVINTLSALLLSDDYLDPWFVSGAELGLRRDFGTTWRGRLAVAGERHRSATLVRESSHLNSGAAFRAVLPIDDGDLASATIGIQRVMPDPRAATWGLSAAVEAGAFEGSTYIRPTLTASVLRTSAGHDHQLLLTASTGLVSAGAPAQRLFLLGGLNTLPGYDYRQFAGPRYGLAQAEASTSLLSPWLRLRFLAAAGAAGGLAPRDAAVDDPDAALMPLGWPAVPSDGFRTSAGAGLSLFYDLLRVDAVRGLNGGRWQLQLSFHRDFWDIS
jgi:hypothetical protein